MKFNTIIFNLLFFVVLTYCGSNNTKYNKDEKYKTDYSLKENTNLLSVNIKYKSKDDIYTIRKNFIEKNIANFENFKQQLDIRKKIKSTIEELSELNINGIDDLNFNDRKSIDTVDKLNDIYSTLLEN